MKIFYRVTLILSLILFLTMVNLFALSVCKVTLPDLRGTLSNAGCTSRSASTSGVSENSEATTSENTRQMSSALDAAGKRVFTAYATKLNAMHNVIVHDRNGNAVPFAANVASNTLYHNFDKPLVFVKRPGSDSQYFLFTQVSNGASDFLYRHTLDASLPGNGSLEEPLGKIIETDYPIYTNGNALRYGVAVQAMQNVGSNNTTWMYFLRSSNTQVQLTAQVLNSSGTFGSSISLAAVNGTPIGKIKFSPDGKQLLFAYLPSAVLNQIQLAVIRRYGIGPNGELALLEEIPLDKGLLEFELSPDGKFIYYGVVISETLPVGFGKQVMRSGKKFRVRRWNFTSQTDEFVGDSYNDEIFNGKHLALQRSANGRIYISAAGHRRMMVINDPGSVTIPALTGEEITDNDPGKAAYLSGAFATVAFDHHFHSIQNNGTFYATRNKREYEMKDHLGNANVVVSDLRASDGSAIVVSSNNYYPYGMIMPGRNYNSADYRYGFNGMEKDDEIKGTGNSYDFGARLYDSRAGRWLTRDPLAEKFPGWSDYNAFFGNPILYVDLDGREPKEYVLVSVRYEVLKSGVKNTQVVLVVKDKDWERRALQIVWNENVRVTQLVELDSWKSINELIKEWRGWDLTRLSIENEVQRDLTPRSRHSERRGLPRSVWPRLRGPGASVASAAIALDFADGEKVATGDVVEAVGELAIPPIVDILKLEGDQPDYAADYDLNSRALESLKYHSPQCFDTWFNTFRVHSEYCDSRFEEEKEYLLTHPPGKHWFKVTTEMVQRIIQRSKNE